MIEKYKETFVIRDNVLLLYNSFDNASVTINDGIACVAQASFMGHTEIESVFFPESITEIAKFAFAECHRLKKIRIGKNVKKIADDAFDGCYDLSVFEVDEHNTNFTSIDGVIYSKDCKTLIRVPPNYCGNEIFVIPYGVKEIAVNAFNRVSGIKQVVIPDSVNTIGYKAFCYCNNLEGVSIGKNITKIGYCAFSNAYSLKSINVDKDNENYIVYNDALYTIDKKTLVQLPCAAKITTFTIIDSVENIEDRALSGHNYLTEIVSVSPLFKTCDGVLFNSTLDILLVYPSKKINDIYNVPESVTEIAGSAFQGCTNLLAINLGSKLRKISRHGFEGSSIKRVIGGESLEHIGWCSFSHCKNLTQLDFTNTLLSYINGGAFSFCSNLKKVRLPSSVNHIIRWSFMGCVNLTSIEFLGDINQLLFDGASFFITEDEFGKIY